MIKKVISIKNLNDKNLISDDLICIIPNHQWQPINTAELCVRHFLRRRFLCKKILRQ